METIVGILSELHSSVPSDDDLLTEILLRLPVVSLLRFKSVSKHWLSLIKSPYFTLRCNQKFDPPSGLFLELLSDEHKWFQFLEYDLVRLDKTSSSPAHTTFPFQSCWESSVKILHSCNGLLLCRIGPHKLFVYNPSTNQFKLLPQDPYSEFAIVSKLAKLAFDPFKSPQYKVVYPLIAFGDVHHSIQIHTYSSETDNWSVSPHRFLKNDFLDFKNGIYWNGGVHWLAIGPLHYKLDVNHFVLTTIQNPPTLDGKKYYDHNLFESRGCLLHACFVYTYSTPSRELNVYEMKNGCSEWSVKYLVDIDYVMTLIPKTPEMPEDADGEQPLCLRYVVVGEREEDSFLVLEVSGKVVKYKIILKTLSNIYECTGSSVSKCFPFIPCLSGV